MSKTAIRLVICLMTAYPYVAFAEEKTSARPFLDFSVGFRRSLSYKISNLPLSIRSVPLHEGDEYLSDREEATEPLPDRLFVFDPGLMFDLDYSFYPLSFISVGGVLTYHPSPHGGVDSENRYQQNQYGTSSRGRGTSLRWYEVTNETFLFGVTGSLVSPWLRFPPCMGLRTKAGGAYCFYGLRFVAESGWDRYTADQTWKRDTIAKLDQHNLFLELDLAFHESRRMENYEDIFGYVYLRMVKYYEQFNLEEGYHDVVFESEEIFPTFTFGIGLHLAFFKVI